MPRHEQLRPERPPGSLLNTTLLAPGERILVALSGGADSLALLHLLAARRADLRVTVDALHVHHGMRGAAADADVRSLERMCEAQGLAFHVEYVDVPGAARERRISVEEAGRDARYAAFAAVAARFSIDKIATAHHADDQVETVLLSLLRGGGPDGLTGVPEQRPLLPGRERPTLIRPLLRRTHAELEAYCRAHGLEPLHDATNDDLRYRRNRIRAEVLPLLERIEPRVRRHLLRLSALALEDRGALETAASALLAAARCGGADPAMAALDLPPLLQAPRAVRRRTLRMLLRSLDREPGSPSTPDGALVDRLLDLVEGSVDSAINLPGLELRARRSGARLEVERMGHPAPAGSIAVIPPLAGTLPVPGRPWRLRIDVVDLPILVTKSCEAVSLDLDALVPPLTLRPAQPGDRLRPLGAPGTRSVSDVLSSRKVPRAERPGWPVVADAAGVVWVVGHPIADRARIQPETRRGLRLELQTVPDEPGR